MPEPRNTFMRYDPYAGQSNTPGPWNPDVNNPDVNNLGTINIKPNKVRDNDDSTRDANGNEITSAPSTKESSIKKSSSSDPKGDNIEYKPGPEIDFNKTYKRTYDEETGKYTSSLLSEADPKKSVAGYEYEAKGDPVDSDTNELSFVMPDYGYDRHLMDIRNWQKQLVSYGAEPGWFFFKIFFNFHTNYGLLGGVLKTVENKADIARQANQGFDLTTEEEQRSAINDTDDDWTRLQSANTAYGYLQTVRKLHKYELINERILALSKFIGTLKDITLRTPWVFRSVSGLNSINQTYTQDLDKDKSFVIGLSEETLDQRIGTLIDLYKFAAFDQINCKEVIPANLRKFETTIMVYHMPLKYMHNKVVVGKDYAPKGNGVIEAASTTMNTSSDVSGFDNMMSFKMYTFLNCEIDTETLGEYYPDGVSNETPFQIGKNGLKIKYDRVYEHRMNEWNEMFFGSDGFYYNNDFDLNGNINSRIATEISESFKNKYETKNISDSIYRNRMKALAAQQKITGGYSIADYTDIVLGKYYGLTYRVRNSFKIGVGDLVFGIQGQWNNFLGRVNAMREMWGSSNGLSENNNDGTNPGYTATVRP